MSEQTEQVGRDAGGRFGKGNSGGPGNPFAKQTARLRAAALSELSADEIRQLMRRLYVNGMRGDVAAAKLVLAYTIGKPERVVDTECPRDEEPTPAAVPAEVPATPSGGNPEAKTPFVDGGNAEPSRPQQSVRDTIKSFTPEMLAVLAKMTNPRPPQAR